MPRRTKGHSRRTQAYKDREAAARAYARRVARRTHAWYQATGRNGIDPQTGLRSD